MSVHIPPVEDRLSDLQQAVGVLVQAHARGAEPAELVILVDQLAEVYHDQIEYEVEADG